MRGVNKVILVDLYVKGKSIPQVAMEIFIGRPLNRNERGQFK